MISATLYRSFQIESLKADGKYHNTKAYYLAESVMSYQAKKIADLGERLFNNEFAGERDEEDELIRFQELLLEK